MRDSQTVTLRLEAAELVLTVIDWDGATVERALVPLSIETVMVLQDD